MTQLKLTELPIIYSKAPSDSQTDTEFDYGQEHKRVMQELQIEKNNLIEVEEFVIPTFVDLTSFYNPFIRPGMNEDTNVIKHNETVLEYGDNGYRQHIRVKENYNVVRAMIEKAWEVEEVKEEVENVEL
jgi:hypothetical protein